MDENYNELVSAQKAETYIYTTTLYTRITRFIVDSLT